MEFAHSSLLPLGPDTTQYRLLTTHGVDLVDGPRGRRMLTVDPAMLRRLTDEAMHDMRDHAVYYAGPAKTPAGFASGSFGPTTAGRMDSYVERFQAAGGSLVMLAKGNRSGQVTDACRRFGGFYLGSIGGPAARLPCFVAKRARLLHNRCLASMACLPPFPRTKVPSCH